MYFKPLIFKLLYMFHLLVRWNLLVSFKSYSTPPHLAQGVSESWCLRGYFFVSTSLKSLCHIIYLNLNPWTQCQCVKHHIFAFDKTKPHNFDKRLYCVVKIILLFLTVLYILSIPEWNWNIASILYSKNKVNSSVLTVILHFRPSEITLLWKCILHRGLTLTILWWLFL